MENFEANTDDEFNNSDLDLEQVSAILINTLWRNLLESIHDESLLLQGVDPEQFSAYRRAAFLFLIAELRIAFLKNQSDIAIELENIVPKVLETLSLYSVEQIIQYQLSADTLFANVSLQIELSVRKIVGMI